MPNLKNLDLYANSLPMINWNTLPEATHECMKNTWVFILHSQSWNQQNTLKSASRFILLGNVLRWKHKSCSSESWYIQVQPPALVFGSLQECAVWRPLDPGWVVPPHFEANQTHPFENAASLTELPVKCKSLQTFILKSFGKWDWHDQQNSDSVTASTRGPRLGEKHVHLWLYQWILHWLGQE